MYLLRCLHLNICFLYIFSLLNSRVDGQVVCFPGEPCNDRLDPCNTRLKPCNDRLEPCNARLEPCNDRLEPCNDRLEPCNARLEPCNDRLEPITELVNMKSIKFRNYGQDLGSLRWQIKLYKMFLFISSLCLQSFNNMQ